MGKGNKRPKDDKAKMKPKKAEKPSKDSNEVSEVFKKAM